MGGHVPGEQIDQERREVNGAEVVRVVVAERAVPGRLGDKGPVRRAELDFDLEFGVANVVALQPEQLTPTQTAPRADDPHDEVVIASGEDGAPFGQQQRLQRRGPGGLPPGCLCAPLRDAPATASPGPRVDADQARVLGVPQDRRQEIASVTGGVGGVPLAELDLPGLDLLPFKNVLMGKCPKIGWIRRRKCWS